MSTSISPRKFNSPCLTSSTTEIFSLMLIMTAHTVKAYLCCYGTAPNVELKGQFFLAEKTKSLLNQQKNF